MILAGPFKVRYDRHTSAIVASATTEIRSIGLVFAIQLVADATRTSFTAGRRGLKATAKFISPLRVEHSPFLIAIPNGELWPPSSSPKLLWVTIRSFSG
jgi:hypothetical protein